MKKYVKYIKDKMPITRYLWAIGCFFIGKSSLHKLGWFKSARKMSSIDREGRPIPWLTYAAVNFLEKRIPLKSKYRVFEFGSGNSTLWWAVRSSDVTSVEYDKSWFESMSNKLKSYKNANIEYCELGTKYPLVLKKNKTKYDIIVIDGRMRVDCARIASKALSKTGIIIWDNTERNRYAKGIEFLNKEGFKSIDFFGPAPIDNVVTQTSIFYREKNLLNI